MNAKKKEYFFSFIGVITLLFLFTSAFSLVMDLPTVHISYTTGECVKVFTRDGEKNCSSIDLKNDRYDPIHVP